MNAQKFWPTAQRFLAARRILQLQACTGIPMPRAFHPVASEASNLGGVECHISQCGVSTAYGGWKARSPHPPGGITNGHLIKPRRIHHQTIGVLEWTAGCREETGQKLFDEISSAALVMKFSSARNIFIGL